ncbi:hypothetical protein LEMLEM_LOCUS2851 [Lemmus lemmus]
MADSVFVSIFWDPHPGGTDTGSDFSGLCPHMAILVRRGCLLSALEMGPPMGVTGRNQRTDGERSHNA